MAMAMALASAALHAQEKGYTIKGRLMDCGDGKLMIMYRDPRTNDQLVRDSTEYHDGVFTYHGQFPTQDVVLLVFNRFQDGAPVQAPPLRVFARNGDEIDVNGSCEQFEFAEVKGSIYNDQFNALKALIKDDRTAMMSMVKEQEIDEDRRAQLQTMAKAISDKELAFVKQHPDYMVSAMLLAIELHLEGKQLAAIYAGLAPAVKQGQYGRMLQKEFADDKEFGAGAVGAGFVKKDLSGNTVDLAAYKGKYVLLDFWGSWCGPCRAGNPHLKELYAEYKDKGLAIIGIANENGRSLAECEAAWKKAVHEDGLPWVQVLNNDGMEKTDVRALYNVTAFPTKILLGPDGRIIGRYTGTAMAPGQKDELAEKLREVLRG